MIKNLILSRKAAELIGAQQSHCWQNAARVMSLPGFEGARYIEGVVVAQSQLVPQEHAWVVINEEIIDPTLPEKELTYFPALEWTNGQFHRPFFEGGDMPLFRRLVFLSDGVQVEMDLSRQKAWQFIAARGNSSGGSSAP